MRSYSVAVAALALQAPLKWTDNAIAKHPIPSVLSERRGVARRVQFSALLVLAIARELQLEMGTPLGAALEIAHQVAAGGHPDGVRRGALCIVVDLARLRDALEERLADAMESAPTPRRGRPPGGVK